MKTEHLQPDGTSLTVDFAETHTLDPWQSQVHVNAPTDGRVSDARRRRTFHVAHRGNYDWMIATRFEGIDPYREKAGAGEILVYASKRTDATQGLNLWRGPHHEVQAYLPNLLAADGPRAAEHMQGLAFEDSPVGLTIHPSKLSGETVQVHESFTYVPMVGSLTFHPAAVGLGFVPAWRGAKVRAGELWQSQDADQPPHLILASPEAVCVLVPSGDVAGANALTRSSLVAKGVGLAQSINSISLR